MSAPIPKTKAQAIFDEITSLNTRELGEFTAARLLREVNTAIKAGVDLPMSWFCKGVIHALTRDPDNMLIAFRNANNYQPKGTSAFYFNQAVYLKLYGYFDEAMKLFSYSQDDDARNLILHIASATFKYDIARQYFIEGSSQMNYLENCERVIQQRYGLKVEELQKVIDIFLSEIKQRKLQFCMVRDQYTDDEIQKYFEIQSDDSTINEIIYSYDIKTSNVEMFDTASKLTLIANAYTEIDYSLLEVAV